jgi:hypothetical protein
MRRIYSTIIKIIREENKPKGIMRMTGTNNKDLETLIDKKFIIFFEEDGIAVVKHWRLSNTIKNDRYRETKYKELKNRLGYDKNGAYTEAKTEAETERNQVGTEVEPQIRLGKVRLGKEKEESASAPPPRLKTESDETKPEKSRLYVNGSL